jgi:hypothetical protein
MDSTSLDAAGECFVNVGCKMSQYGEGMLFQPPPYPEVWP